MSGPPFEEIARRHGARLLLQHGSTVSGQTHAASDVDFAVRHGAIVVLACAAGFAWATLLAHARMGDALPVEWEGRDIVVDGVVASLPQACDRSMRFEFDVDPVQTAAAVVPRRIVLSWWSAGGRDGAPVVLPEVHPGERWQFTVRLKRPHGLANPHGSDYEAWLLERGIRASGYVRPKGGHLRLEAQVQAPAYGVERLREHLRARIQAALPDAPAAGVIAALVMGDQRAIPPEQWQVFTRTGVNHLMSISGLHVTMLSGLAFALVNFAWRRSARLTLELPARSTGRTSRSSRASMRISSNGLKMRWSAAVSRSRRRLVVVNYSQ